MIGDKDKTIGVDHAYSLSHHIHLLKCCCKKVSSLYLPPPTCQVFTNLSFKDQHHATCHDFTHFLSIPPLYKEYLNIKRCRLTAVVLKVHIINNHHFKPARPIHQYIYTSPFNSCHHNHHHHHFGTFPLSASPSPPSRPPFLYHYCSSAARIYLFYHLHPTDTHNTFHCLFFLFL